MLVEQTHAIRHEVRSNERAMRFTDTRLDEQQRGVSLKMVPLSLVMAGGKGKSYLLNLIDTPGAPAARPSRSDHCQRQLCELRRAALFCSVLGRLQPWCCP